MAYHALISPQGHVEYNAEFVLGAGVASLEHGRWYTNEELNALSEVGVLMKNGTVHKRACFLRDSPGCTEKNVKKWRYERQG